MREIVHKKLLNKASGIKIITQIAAKVLSVPFAGYISCNAQ
jgi:hypothetical protein